LRSRVCAFVTAARWLSSDIGSVAPARGFTHAVWRIACRFPPPMPDRSVFITSVVHRIAGYGSLAFTFSPATVTLPRETIIATGFGEASIVKVEVEGQQGETTLTTRSEPYNQTAIHAESGC
jgi:hypothetical protein